MIRKKKLKKFNFDKLKEECGIFGISNHEDASALVALGLHALQHRGQEGCGIVSFDGKNYHSEKRHGLVGDHFTDQETLKKLPGFFAIGHNRYSTTGETSLRNIQPFFADLHMGGLSLAHNGNLTNALLLREDLVKEGAIFRTTSDTETIVQLIAKSKREKFLESRSDNNPEAIDDIDDIDENLDQSSSDKPLDETDAKTKIQKTAKTQVEVN